MIGYPLSVVHPVSSAIPATAFLWLALACVLDFGFGQLFKGAERLGCRLAVVVSANYLTLGAALTLYLLLRGELTLTGDIAALGVVTGCSFICSLSIMTRALARANVAAVLTAFRMSIVVPVVAGAWIWGERIGIVQIVGILLALLGLYMITRGSNTIRSSSIIATLLIVAAVFLSQGISHSCLRWVSHAGLDSQKLKVLLVVGWMAGSLGALLVVQPGHRPRRSDLLMGLGIGIYNLVALVAILTALSWLSAAAFFPTVACASVMLDGLTAHFFWKERLGPLARVGVCVAVMAVVLVLQNHS